MSPDSLIFGNPIRQFLAEVLASKLNWSSDVMIRLRKNLSFLRSGYAFFVASIILVALSQLTSCAPKPEEECGFVQNSFGQRISWKGSVPVNFWIHESVPEAMRPSLERAFKTWQNQLGKPIFAFVGILKGPNQDGQDGKNVLYWRTAWDDKQNKEQARTNAYYTQNRIEEADIVVNAKNFSYFDGDTQIQNTSYRVHFPSLLTHELGHVLGLKHDDSGASAIMPSELMSGVERIQLSEKDIKSILCEY
jgi:Matrixin